MKEDKETEYVPFGSEWEKEVAKLPKSFIIEMLRNSLKAERPRELVTDVWETLLEVQREIGSDGSLAKQVKRDVINLEEWLKKN